MSWEEFVKKITSRKLWVAICAFVGELLALFNVCTETSTKITALIMMGATVIAYIVGEGLVDKAAARALVMEENYFYDDEDVEEIE